MICNRHNLQQHASEYCLTMHVNLFLLLLSNSLTSATQHEGGDLQESVDLPGPVAHGEIRHLIDPHDHLRVLTVREVNHWSVIRQTTQKKCCMRDLSAI